MSYTGRMAETTPPRAAARKPSSVRHTRAIQRDRSKRPPAAPPDPVVAARLTEIIHPATLAQLDRLRALGLRKQVLTLPVMVALVTSMIWRRIGSVAPLLRVLNDAGFLWASPVQVSEPALSQRLRVFPAELFRGVLEAVLPPMQARWAERPRPVPPALAWAQTQYPAVLTVEGSTLDALLRRVGLLRDLCWLLSPSALDRRPVVVPRHRQSPRGGPSEWRSRRRAVPTHQPIAVPN